MNRMLVEKNTVTCRICIQEMKERAGDIRSNDVGIPLATSAPAESDGFNKL